MTTWEQIGVWLTTRNTSNDVGTCHFWNREDRCFLDKQDSICSIVNDSIPIPIDGIDDKDVIEIILSYDKSKQTIPVLKSCSVSYLLNNPRYLQIFNLKNPPTDYTLVLINETTDRILSMEDLQKPIRYYSTTDNEILHFQISILIELIPLDNQPAFQLPISKPNLTIKEFLRFDHLDSHLASIDTRMILPNNKKFSQINERKFYLAKAHQICSITIEEMEDSPDDMTDHTIIQQFIIDTTMADIYKQNSSIIQDQHLLYEKDFIPSAEIALSAFLPTVFPIEFKITDREFPANITVSNGEEQTSVRFSCLPSISIGRICEIACRLFHFDSNFYCLTLSDDTTLENDYRLDELGESINRIHLKLTSKADVTCQVIYEDRTILIPANNETKTSTILNKVLMKLSIPVGDSPRYELSILDDPSNPTAIDLELFIEDIRSFFPSDLVLIPFQLRKI